MTRRDRIILAATTLFGLLPTAAFAHEAYVLPYATFWSEIRGPIDPMVFNALRDPDDLRICGMVIGGTLLALALNFLFRRTALGTALHRWVERFAAIGPVALRLSVAIALFVGAQSGSFLGPELHMSLMPFPSVIRWTLTTAGICIALGFLTELAALAALAVFLVGCSVFGVYLFTYLNYLGEFIALALFGMRHWSVDAKVFGPLKRWVRWEKYETSIIRVFYGCALLYAGINVKLLHPALTIQIVNDWHLTSFHALFPSDPVLVTLGGGLAEAAIGLFIIFGFELRLTVLVSLFYITLSLFYFRELVWPHILLYGLSLDLLVQPEIFTLDHLFFEEHRKALAWWKRPFQHHRPEVITGSATEK